MTLLNLWIVNRHDETHEFLIVGSAETHQIIEAGDSVMISKSFDKAGSFVFHDPSNYPINTYLGLAGMILVKDHNDKAYIWNIKEHDVEWNELLMNGQDVDWDTYYPRYFTINGHSFPNTTLDEKATIKGKVGEKLYIYIANTGQSIHPIHFHGYHVTIEYSSKFPEHKNRSKDTPVIYPMETMVLSFIPHQPGIYPVHNHNLIAVTGAGIYPNGMLATLEIEP